MKPLHIDTPLIESLSLGRIVGKPVYLKMDALQPSGSFKIRGIGHLCQKLAEDGATHFVSSSGGNAGIAAAYAGRKLGIKTTVIVPQTTPVSMRERIALEGAEVRVFGSVWDDAHQEALRLAQEPKVGYVHPFDHPLIWKGHASLIAEMVKEGLRPGCIAVAVGGGGLLCGILEGLHEHGLKDIPVIACEVQGAAALIASMQKGKLVVLDKVQTIATSLGTKTVAAQALDWTQKHRILSHVSSDGDAVEACLKFADDHRVLVEPACGAALAPLYKNAPLLKEFSSILAIVCGGVGVTLQQLQSWKENFKKIPTAHSPSGPRN